MSSDGFLNAPDTAVLFSVHNSFVWMERVETCNLFPPHHKVSVFSRSDWDFLSPLHTHTLYILFLTLIDCLRWSQYHFNSSKYQVHMWLFIIIWKFIINVLICFKCPAWKCAYYFCFIYYHSVRESVVIFVKRFCNKPLMLLTKAKFTWSQIQ